MGFDVMPQSKKRINYSTPPSPYWNYVVLSNNYSENVFEINKRTLIFPKKAPTKTLGTMTEQEIASLEKEYCCRINKRYKFGLA